MATHTLQKIDSVSLYLPFLPEAILPSQFFHSQQSEHDWVHRVSAAIVEDALICLSYKQGSKRVRDLYREARAWFLAEDSDHAFAFANICELFSWPLDQWQKAISEKYPDLPPLLRHAEKTGMRPRASVRLTRVVCFQKRISRSYILVGGRCLLLKHEDIRTEQTPLLEKGHMGDLVVRKSWAVYHHLIDDHGTSEMSKAA